MAEYHHIMRPIRLAIPNSLLQIRALSVPAPSPDPVGARVRQAVSSKRSGKHVLGHRRVVAPGRMVLIGGYTRGR